MNQHLKHLLNLSLIMLATALLIWGILMAYENWSALTGIVVIVIGWVLLSLVHTFVKREAKA
jgi:hypothetical protein